MLEFRTEAVRDFLDAVHVAFPASAKTGILESHTDSLRQQPFRKTDGWQGATVGWPSAFEEEGSRTKNSSLAAPLTTRTLPRPSTKIFSAILPSVAFTCCQCSVTRSALPRACIRQCR